MMHLLAAVAIAGVTLHTGQGPPIQDATLLIEGDRVVALGHEVTLPPETDQRET